MAATIWGIVLAIMMYSVGSGYEYGESSNNEIFDYGNGTCSYTIRVPERVLTYELVKRRCDYYWERCYSRYENQSKISIVEKSMTTVFCCTGYSSHDGQEYNCAPICDPICVNGYCSSPGVCQCLDNYAKVPTSDSYCEPVCDPPCANSTCEEGNICKCHEGFSETNLHVCGPVCTAGCSLAGECIAPETCSCHEGYVLAPTDASVCLPVCHRECYNGFCSGVDQCSCNAGFIPSPASDSWNVCFPHCSEECVNALCVAPETCTCLAGYENTGNSTYTCSPHCSVACVNSVCSAPNYCACHEGYEKTTRTQCLPACYSGCENGECVAPETCKCNIGYEESTGGCAPSCDTDCINGLCTAPNECTCNNGTLKTGQSQCLKTCDNYSFDADCVKYVTVFTDDLTEYPFNVPCNSSDLSLSATITFQCYTELDSDRKTSICSYEEVLESSPNKSSTEDSYTTYSTPINLTDNENLTMLITFIHPETFRLCPARFCSKNIHSSFPVNQTTLVELCVIGASLQGEHQQTVSKSIVLIASLLSLVVAAIVGGVFVYMKNRTRWYRVGEHISPNETTSGIVRTNFAEERVTIMDDSTADDELDS